MPFNATADGSRIVSYITEMQSSGLESNATDIRQHTFHIAKKSGIEKNQWIKCMILCVSVEVKNPTKKRRISQIIFLPDLLLMTKIGIYMCGCLHIYMFRHKSQNYRNRTAQLPWPVRHFLYCTINVMSHVCTMYTNFMFLRSRFRHSALGINCVFHFFCKLSSEIFFLLKQIFGALRSRCM